MSMHSIWMIGDIQGCCGSLDELLAHPEIAQEPLARFWFAGDLVNRGSQSLATLRRLMALEERSVAILGNHDLHLLAVAAGVRRLGKNDTLLEILEAPDCEDLINWLRWRPMAHFELDHLMVHAGVLPKWDVQKHTNHRLHDTEAVILPINANLRLYFLLQNLKNIQYPL